MLVTLFYGTLIPHKKKKARSVFKFIKGWPSGTVYYLSRISFIWERGAVVAGAGVKEFTSGFSLSVTFHRRQAFLKRHFVPVGFVSEEQ